MYTSDALSRAYLKTPVDPQTSGEPVVEQFLTKIGFSNDKKQKRVQKMKQKKYFDKNVRELPHLKKGDCIRLRDVSDKK